MLGYLDDIEATELVDAPGKLTWKSVSKLRKLGVLCRSKLNGRFFFAGSFFRVFDRGQNNCYFYSTVKNTNVPHRLVFFAAPFSFDRHNTQ